MKKSQGKSSNSANSQPKNSKVYPNKQMQNDHSNNSNNSVNHKNNKRTINARLIKREGHRKVFHFTHKSKTSVTRKEVHQSSPNAMLISSRGNLVMTQKW